jgi:hypothetical protein
VPSFNRTQVCCRRRPDAGVELAQHRQTHLLNRLVFDRVGEFGDVAKRHGPLGNRILVVVGFGQIGGVIMAIVRLVFYSLRA